MLTEIDRRFTSRCSPSHHEEADVSPSGEVPLRLQPDRRECAADSAPFPLFEPSRR